MSTKNISLENEVSKIKEKDVEKQENKNETTKLEENKVKTQNEVIKDENGNIIELRCTYDPETKSGSGFTGRKVKGTIHWVSAKHAVKATVNLYDSLVVPSEEDEKELVENKNSLIVLNNAYIEPSILNANKMDRFQFIRNGYFIADSKHFDKDNLVFNRIVSLKSSFKP